MRRAILVAVALCCFVVGGADAYFENGNSLYGHCQKPRISVFGALCGGYVSGVLDALENLGASCVPGEATREQVTDVVTLYLRDHPEKRHLSASELVTAALKEKFPCN
jgi:hypothetical protein